MQTFEEFWYQIQEYDLKTNLLFPDLQVGFKYVNGCGSKGGWHFPSTMWGINIEAACNLHDIEWKLAKCYADLLMANERFDNNLKKITDAESSNNFTRWIRRSRINKYVSGVELIGTEAYAKERGFING